MKEVVTLLNGRKEKIQKDTKFETFHQINTRKHKLKTHVFHAIMPEHTLDYMGDSVQ